MQNSKALRYHPGSVCRKQGAMEKPITGCQRTSEVRDSDNFRVSTFLARSYIRLPNQIEEAKSNIGIFTLGILDRLLVEITVKLQDEGYAGPLLRLGAPDNPIPFFHPIFPCALDRAPDFKPSMSIASSSACSTAARTKSSALSLPARATVSRIRFSCSVSFSKQSQSTAYRIRMSPTTAHTRPKREHASLSATAQSAKMLWNPTCLTNPPESSRMDKKRILIADDQPDVLEALRLLLKAKAIRSNPPTPRRSRCRARDPRLRRRPDGPQLHARHNLRPGRPRSPRANPGDRPHLPVVVMTAWGSVDLAVEAMRRGARDFVQKPWDNARLLAILRTQVELSEALRRQRLEAENRLLRSDGGRR